jgi:hypothetical protein
VRALLTAAAAQIVREAEDDPDLVLTGVFLAILLFGPIYERLFLGRVHRVMLWGGVGVFATVLLRGVIGRTVAWHHIAAYLVR